MTKLTTTEYVAIGGLILASYGAILSTINSIVQIIAHRKDRADVMFSTAQLVAPRMSKQPPGLWAQSMHRRRLAA